MDKSKLHHYWLRWRLPSLIVCIAGLLVFSLTALYALRDNNIRMIALKEAVIRADEQSGDIEGALQELRSFVYSHMNTQLRSEDASEPPIQLVNQFNKYIAAEQAKLESNGTLNETYIAAQKQCETWALRLAQRAECIQEYVIANGGDEASITVPPKELYTFDFASPKWSPDIAGISIVLAVLFSILLVIRLIVGRIITYQLK